MKRLIAWLLILATLCLSACRPSEDALLGTLEWDRISVPVEMSEVITQVHVQEGQQVKQGALLLELDNNRATAHWQRLQAEVAVAQAQLDQLTNGSRREDVAVASAEWARQRALLQDAEMVFERQRDLRKRGLTAQANVDQAKAARDAAFSASKAAKANVDKLGVGARSEEVAAALALLQARQAAAAEFALSLARLQVHAPRDARVDALPFKLGDQPPVGASLVSLLVGERPYARVFIPASKRAQFSNGSKVSLQVQGYSTPFNAVLRRIAAEPSFTPYYALTGNDASRLVYRAELELSDSSAAQLPAGLPVRVQLP